MKIAIDKLIYNRSIQVSSINKSCYRFHYELLQNTILSFTRLTKIK